MAMKRNVEEAKSNFDEAVNAAGTKTVEAETKTVNAAGTKTVEAETKTVAKAAPTVVAKAVKRDMVNVFSGLEDQFTADYGMLPRIKASNGNCMDGDDKILGAEIEIQVLSWNKNYVASPCNKDAPSDLVKYSLNREAFDDGTGGLDEYISDLKKAGWADACVKEYFDVVAVLVKSEKDSEHTGEMVQLQLAPTSVKAFNGFRLQTGFKIARGLLSADSLKTIKASAEVVSANGYTWTKFSFSPIIKY